MTIFVEKLSIPRWLKGSHTASIMHEVYYQGDERKYVHEAGWLTNSAVNTYRSDGSSAVRLQKYAYITELSAEAQDVTGSPIEVVGNALLSVNTGLDRRSACKLSTIPPPGCPVFPDNKWNWKAEWYSGEMAHSYGGTAEPREYEYPGAPRIAKLMDGTYIRDVIWGDNSDIKFYYHAWWHPPQLGQEYAAWDYHHFWGSDYKEEPQPARVNLYKKGVICLLGACFAGSVGDSHVGDLEWHACTGYVNGSDCDDPLEIPAGNCDQQAQGTRWPHVQNGPWWCMALTHTAWGDNLAHKSPPPGGVGLSQLPPGEADGCGACSVIDFDSGSLWTQLRAVAVDHVDDWHCPGNGGSDEVGFFIPSSSVYPPAERRFNADNSNWFREHALIERYVGWYPNADGNDRVWGEHVGPEGRYYLWVETYNYHPLPDWCQ